MTEESTQKRPLPQKPHMDDAELALYDSFLARSSRYLEFGAGGSTRRALERDNISFIQSVETDANLVEALQEDETAKEAISQGRLRLIHAKVGPVGGWGFPVDQTLFSSWRPFLSDIWSGLDTDADTCLIDGRCRLYTSLMCVMMMPEAVFLFHDFTVRPYYHPLLQFIDIIAIANTLIAYKAKPVPDLRALACALRLGITDLR